MEMSGDYYFNVPPAVDVPLIISMYLLLWMSHNIEA
jgi:hypothetical protein